MFDSLWAWAQAHPGPAVGSVGIVGFGLYAIYAYWDVIKPHLPGFLGGTTKVTTPTAGTIATRRQVLDYLDASYTYFKSVGCMEGMEAIEQAVGHAFHEHPQPPVTTPSEAATQIANIIGAALHPTTAAPTTATTNEPPTK